MKYIGFILLVFGITLIIFPELLAYMLGMFFIILGGSLLLVRSNKNTKKILHTFFERK